MNTKAIRCAECRFAFKPEDVVSVKEISCPICGTAVPTSQKTSSRPVAETKPASKQLVVPSAKKRPRVEPLPPPPKPDEACIQRTTFNHGLFLIFGGLALLLLSGVGLAAFVWSSAQPRSLANADVRQDDAAAPPISASTMTPATLTVPPQNTQQQTNASNDRPVTPAALTPPRHQPPPAPNPIRPSQPPQQKKRIAPELDKRVHAAIDKGVRFLRQAAETDKYTREMALVGWTLLECGVPANDPLIQRITQVLRSAAPGEVRTYESSLMILFFDRLGDDRDQNLIRKLALRLVCGQLPTGDWSYANHTQLTRSHEEVLIEYLKSVTYVPRNEAPKQKVALPPELNHIAVLQVREKGPQGDMIMRNVFGPGGIIIVGNGSKVYISDNSNTQFALLGLWVAYRRGIPLQPVLALAGKFFRSTQHQNGSWGYRANLPQVRVDSMTCAGLFGLAVDQSVQGPAEKRQQQKDEAIEKAFQFISKRIGQAPPRGKLVGASTWGDLYYLWSLERVAMIYDLDTIGGKDWYTWAANILLDAQYPDGYWKDAFGPIIDTCFALLVLKRVNVAEDLTTNLKTIIDIKGSR
ncbi:MAG: hypothetical protein KatS3mg105_1651 [Gemmatales bacterium]|nr:MAG: hypothetical protein KatS3mg105_1651 [Gemmatales bacterium]